MSFRFRDIYDQLVRIADDASLSPEQKRTALQSLAQQGRAQILGTLGAGAGEAYVQTARWVNYIERGMAVTFGPDGAPTPRPVAPPRPPSP